MRSSSSAQMNSAAAARLPVSEVPTCREERLACWWANCPAYEPEYLIRVIQQSQVKMRVSPGSNRARFRSFFHWRKERRSLFLDEQDDGFGRLCIAGVSSDEMNTFRIFIECVPGMKCYFFCTLHLHLD
jgi:hypothetical protein